MMILKYNQNRIKKAIVDIKAGKGTAHELIYAALANMGFIISLNTNASLMTPVF